MRPRGEFGDYYVGQDGSRKGKKDDGILREVPASSDHSRPESSGSCRTSRLLEHAGQVLPHLGELQIR